jgi:hypothetical protein
MPRPEVGEVPDHVAAGEFASAATAEPGRIARSPLCELHSLLMAHAGVADRGKLRNRQVMIGGGGSAHHDRDRVGVRVAPQVALR